MYKRRRVNFLLAIVLIVAIVFPFNLLNVNAAMTDEAEEYQLGTEYNGHVNEISSHNGFRAWRYYKFSITEKSHVTLMASAYTTNFVCSIYNSNGKIVLNESDFTLQTNSVTNLSSGSQSRILPAGTYYLMLEGRDTDFTFLIQAEKLIDLPKGVLSEFWVCGIIH